MTHHIILSNQLIEDQKLLMSLVIETYVNDFVDDDKDTIEIFAGPEGGGNACEMSKIMFQEEVFESIYQQDKPITLVIPCNFLIINDMEGSDHGLVLDIIHEFGISVKFILFGHFVKENRRPASRILSVLFDEVDRESPSRVRESSVLRYSESDGTFHVLDSWEFSKNRALKILCQQSSDPKRFIRKTKILDILPIQDREERGNVRKALERKVVILSSLCKEP